ncbi:uncharacterized protein N7469_006449 [Penicillium citrinum]|uniref:Uncharacterized protein n=1 Tax=Penicillium citrinum TaxID=5077 RepID=A0A9W9TME0_PENCI|nr:uncharacterized protein N7469_006449 [Penicillium citrinum]KAJ5231861.1 hypothetical protein N7469_006449 [Penicillium citrinum]
MDRCDMEKRYGYHLDQIKSTVLFRRKRCVTCLKLIRSRRANQRTRKVTGGEEEEVIREEVKYFDWWPEDKVQPMIITGGGSLEYVSGGRFISEPL